jgi:hypothetical protein
MNGSRVGTAGLVALLVAAACAGPGSRPPAVAPAAVPPAIDAKTKTAKVVEIAGAYLRRNGYPTDGYAPVVEQSDGRWIVTYWPTAEKRAAGDFFTVWVDDRTMTATDLIPGK